MSEISEHLSPEEMEALGTKARSNGWSAIVLRDSNDHLETHEVREWRCSCGNRYYTIEKGFPPPSLVKHVRKHHYADIRSRENAAPSDASAGDVDAEEQSGNG